MAQTGRAVARAVQEKLTQALQNPRIEANQLQQLPDCYKIKLRSSGYRLIYQVRDSELLVLVVAIGKRDKQRAYARASDRVQDTE